MSFSVLEVLQMFLVCFAASSIAFRFNMNILAKKISKNIGKGFGEGIEEFYEEKEKEITRKRV